MLRLVLDRNDALQRVGSILIRNGTNNADIDFCVDLRIAFRIAISSAGAGSRRIRGGGGRGIGWRNSGIGRRGGRGIGWRNSGIGRRGGRGIGWRNSGIGRRGVGYWLAEQRYWSPWRSGYWLAEQRYWSPWRSGYWLASAYWSPWQSVYSWQRSAGVLGYSKATGGVLVRKAISVVGVAVEVLVVARIGRGGYCGAQCASQNVLRSH